MITDKNNRSRQLNALQYLRIVVNSLIYTPCGSLINNYEGIKRRTIVLTNSAMVGLNKICKNKVIPINKNKVSEYP